MNIRRSLLDIWNFNSYIKTKYTVNIVFTKERKNHGQKTRKHFYEDLRIQWETLSLEFHPFINAHIFIDVIEFLLNGIKIHNNCHPGHHQPNTRILSHTQTTHTTHIKSLNEDEPWYQLFLSRYWNRTTVVILEYVWKMLVKLY